MDFNREAQTLDEVLYPIRRKDWTYYLVLFGFVGPLWATTPLSWLYVLWALVTGSVAIQWHQHSMLFTVAIIEVRFLTNTSLLELICRYRFFSLSITAIS